MCLLQLITDTVTCSLGSRGTISSSLMLRKAGPSSARPPSLRMPHSRPMKRAVSMLSPVTMRTTMPALLQVATASGTSGRTGSCREQRTEMKVAPAAVPKSCMEHRTEVEVAPPAVSGSCRQGRTQVEGPVEAGTPLPESGCWAAG